MPECDKMDLEEKYILTNSCFRKYACNLLYVRFCFSVVISIQQSLYVNLLDL